MKLIVQLITLLIVALASSVVHGQEIHTQRAHFNYQMFCQGCHTADGKGSNNVPRIKDRVGYFLATTSGREYLVRVPGVATSALDSSDLAEVLNWIILELAGDSVKQPFVPFTSEEVARLRLKPLTELVSHRARLHAEIARASAAE